MSPLELLWFTSLAMAGLALFIMLGLILARFVGAQLKPAREADRRRLIPVLLGGSPADELPSSPPADLIAEVSVELIQLVRGADRERFIERATQLGAPARLRHRLNSGAPRVRLAAAEALGAFSDEASVERLTAALRDRNADVRLTAALSLAGLHRGPSARELVALLGIGTTENSRLAVALMRDIASHRPDEVKALILDPSVPAGAKAAATEALSVSGDYSLVPLVTALATAPEADDEALPRYLSALGAFGHPAAEPAVKEGLRHRSWQVRAAAAEAAGRIGLISLALLLRGLLGDAEWLVRFRAGEALARFGTTGAALLRETAACGQEPARTAAALTLAERELA